MKFNLKELNPATTFYFDDEDKDRGFVKIRVMTLSMTEIINKKTVKKEKVFKRGAYHTTEKIDEDLRNKLIWSYVIVSWSGITDENGNEIEPTDENKLLLFNNSPQFSSFVLECINKLNEQQEIEQEITEKN